MNLAIIITIVSGLLSGIWTVYQFVVTKRREQDLKEFENYHRLIKELVQPDESNTMYADRQAAIIFELRHFRRYYEFSYRTLIGLRENWGKDSNKFPRIMEELNKSIEFLEKKTN